uniref:Uncharacterized protein n=1 Tax=Romanomermis culicivorax TaxID=13658 RepID=A0A915JIF3_ROMCU
MTKFLIAICFFTIIFQNCIAKSSTESLQLDCTKCPDQCYQHHVAAKNSHREALRCCATKKPCSLAHERNLGFEAYYDCVDRAGTDHGKAHDCARKLNLPS